jgi:hypothetical protein
MRFGFALLLALGVGLTLWSGAYGEGDKDKEVTIKGQVICAKCGLSKETKCMTVVLEKKDGKDIIYYFDTDGHKKFHSAICQEAKDGAVTGVVAEKDGKKTITVKDVKYDK